ncbi:sigma-70 family RNA polymerase sigma factor [Halobacillus sp. Marseille-Q1614]|uniref:sigma-70 family RNA polymerase sigma factor n=1 Tax=Halobacillus sp. Marseille-Q1614 TaxID=2709134 RepID=UPI0015714E56|nr:sigma-70 family RNA polymerase sigma factor [Halobacillus sp. Marseille-Q1614]
MTKSGQNLNPLYSVGKKTISKANEAVPSSSRNNYVNESKNKIEAKFVTYLNTSLWRAAKDQQKKVWTWKDLHILNAEHIDNSSPVHEDSLTYDTLFETFENKKLYHALKQLSQRQKFIMYKHAVELYTFKEIADQLGVSQQSVSKSFQRARMKLKNTQGGHPLWD